MDVDTKYLWDTRFELLFRMQLSTLYHQKRERFFELLDKLVKAIAVIGGSLSFSRIVASDAMLVIAATITVSSTLSLVLSFSDRSKRHAELARNFRNLEAEVLGRGERDFVEADLATWAAKVRVLESSEPPALSVLVVACQNELSAAMGQRDKIVPIPFFKNITKNLFDWQVAPVGGQLLVGGEPR